MPGMMPWNVQFLNQNANRAYPLTDWATKAPLLTDGVRLPDSFIVGLRLPIHAGAAVTPDRFFLRSLMVSPLGYSLAIGYDDESDDPPIVAAVNIPRGTHTENMVYAVAGVDDFADTVGQIAIGKLDEIDQLAPALYTFDAAGGALEADAIAPQIRGVVSITVVNGNDRSEKLYGDIELVAGQNMQLVPNTFDSRGPEIVFNAVSGEGLNEECVCEEADDGPCISTINGIPPLPNGDFRVTGNECIEITGIEHGINIEDVCSQPCCGCTELQPLKTQIDRFADAALTLQNFSSRLGAEVTQMSSVVLGSRLGDTGCVECE